MNPALQKVVGVIVTVVFFAVGWFATDWFLNRPKTFTSSNGSFTFSYPGKWKRADPGALSLSGVGGADMTMEIAIADANSELPNLVFFAGSAIAPVDWATAKARVIQGYSGDLSSQLPLGATMTPRTFTDVTIGGKTGLSIKMGLTYQGTTYDCDLIIVQNGVTYQAFMMMAKKPNATLDKFDSILKSLKFSESTK